MSDQEPELFTIVIAGVIAGVIGAAAMLFAVLSALS